MKLGMCVHPMVLQKRFLIYLPIHFPEKVRVGPNFVASYVGNRRELRDK